MKPKHSLSSVVIAVLVGGCGGGAASGPAPMPAEGPGPQLVVERFLQAANANDLPTMTTLFGTAAQRIDQLEPEAVAHRRMYVLASLLRHEDFRIEGQRVVPGRMDNATEVMVVIRQERREVSVPHLVVRRNTGGWIIEKIDVEKLTRGARTRGSRD
ncbi:MAG TPA: hypothetical protein VMM12_13770 [Longimicrobiales bacterium]|nr:hypothetical protein [Longimicrobiales bacterium]